MQQYKKLLLEMDAGTASYKLVKDLLYNFVSSVSPNCYRCGLPLTRSTFSIDHISPWQAAEDPKVSFFDLDNVAYSHLSCNVGAADKTRRVSHGSMKMYDSGCRCVVCRNKASVVQLVETHSA